VYDVVVKKVHVRYLIFWWVFFCHLLALSSSNTLVLPCRPQCNRIDES